MCRTARESNVIYFVQSTVFVVGHLLTGYIAIFIPDNKYILTL